jgi:sugar phosphate isomerase/epimerase
MKISIRERDLHTKLKSIGYDSLDVKFPLWNARDSILSDEIDRVFSEKYEKIREANFTVCQTHLTYYPSHLPPLGDGSYEAFLAYMLPIFEKEIRMTAKMNCPIAVIHLYFEETRDESRKKNLDLLARLLPVAKEAGVTLAIENLYGKECSDIYLTTAEDLLYYTEHFSDDHIGVCLDTGHAIARGQDPIEMLKALGRRVKALHVHSNLKGYDLHLPPCFTKALDFKTFADTLTEIGYEGTFNMEIAPPAQLNAKATAAYYTMVYETARSLFEAEA